MIKKDSVAVVTGGTKGIGLAIAESLLGAGMRVFICGRSKKDLAAALDRLRPLGDVHGEMCDVRSEEQVRQMLEEAERVFGGVDILVNNAGMGVFGKTVEEISGDEFRQMIETNLLGVFYACHHAIPMIKRRSGGYIFNISSLAGQNAHPKMAAYNASKFGLNGFSEALMQEVRQDNIKVSYICPGSVNTYFGGDVPSDEKAWQLQPEDIAQVVLDLLEMNPRALPSKVEIRPSKPPVR
ncbi:MAG TPA: SDR family oxidoreductase [Pyrinomonadaceae bacterium]|nr:SDR family oxidoreductase [Chloracidobacterium sp.]MBP9934946.1 SDR family oxidoreductase [Pyrinomonadaceae bacterium]MBK7803373.1 SDR family oxidoreductase [Chloracidobacterium sp.]MBK9438623.1 SDR family oxidoreductase [Chloracidobacterium sp.]MBK9766676.1 SDR family oxidoreductase [Chloracidobacterium sp.]